MKLRNEGEGLEGGWWAFMRGWVGIWESWRGLRWRYWRSEMVVVVILELEWEEGFMG